MTQRSGPDEPAGSPDSPDHDRDALRGTIARDDPRALSLLTTEHFALQGLRASTISDASSRASLYMASISGTLIALSLLGTATRLGPPFVVTSLVVAPTLIFLGVATYARVLQSALEDTFYGMGINRLRHLYLELAPDLRPYLTQSDRDDVWGFLTNIGAGRGGPWQMMLTTAGSVGVINSVLTAGFGAGLLLELVRVPLRWGIVFGLVVFAASVWTYYWNQQRRWTAFSRAHPALFPSERPGQAP